ncbi:MAG: hypothetical protein QOF71_1321 [Candidatus Eremiobacteraeota bacterium]|jgi:hypothetical protein|nr:hypothetical protein [Candidatus Eremiobacteraeota bacterium]
MVTQQFSATSELEAAARILYARWTLALPTAFASLAIAGIIFFVIGAVIVSAVAAVLMGGRGAAIAAVGAGASTVVFSILVMVLISTAAHAIVLVAAHEAWAGRDPDYGAAFRLTLVRFPALLVAAFATALLYAIPVVLSFLLVGIPLLFVLGYFLMYVRAAIMIGGEDGITAIGTSFRLATSNAGPSLVAFGGIIGAFIIGRIVDAATIHLPVIGLLTAFFIGGATAAYIALVEVRFYELLRAEPVTATALRVR